MDGRPNRRDKAAFPFFDVAGGTTVIFTSIYGKKF